MPGSLTIAALLLGTASAPPAVPRPNANFISETELARSRDAAAPPDSLVLTADGAQRMTVIAPDRATGD